MPATCSACESFAGPTVRVDVDTIRGPVTLALTFEQALDLKGQLEDWVVQLESEVPT